MKAWQHFKTITRHRLIVMAGCFFVPQRAVVGNAFKHSGVVVSVTAERINPFPAKALPIPVYRAADGCQLTIEN